MVTRPTPTVIVNDFSSNWAGIAESSIRTMNGPQSPSFTGVPEMVVLAAVAVKSSVSPSQGVSRAPSPVDWSKKVVGSLQAKGERPPVALIVAL